MLQEYKILVNIIFQGNIGKEMQATQIFELVTALPYSSINLISSLMGLKVGITLHISHLTKLRFGEVVSFDHSARLANEVN